MEAAALRKFTAFTTASRKSVTLPTVGTSGIPCALQMALLIPILLNSCAIKLVNIRDLFFVITRLADFYAFTRNLKVQERRNTENISQIIPKHESAIPQHLFYCFTYFMIKFGKINDPSHYQASPDSKPTFEFPTTFILFYD